MNKNAFTLLETIIAIFVLTVGLIAVMSLAHRAIFAAQIASSRLVAGYLAQEGVEIVRNIRDSNWLAQRGNPALPWDENLAAGNWEADFDDFTLTSFQDRNLKIDGGFYNYSSGENTKFKRKITIARPTQDVIEVFVQITWQERGSSQTLTLEEHLYNWR